MIALIYYAEQNTYALVQTDKIDCSMGVKYYNHPPKVASYSFDDDDEITRWVVSCGSIELIASFDTIDEYLTFRSNCPELLI